MESHRPENYLKKALGKQDGETEVVIDQLMERIESAIKFAEEFPNVEIYEFNSALDHARKELRDAESSIKSEDEPFTAKVYKALDFDKPKTKKNSKFQLKTERKMKRIRPNSPISESCINGTKSVQLSHQST